MASRLQQNHPIPPSILRRFSDSNRLGLDTTGCPESIKSTPRIRHSEFSTTSRHPINYRQSWRYDTGLGSTGWLGDPDATFIEDESQDSHNSARLGDYAKSVSDDDLSSLYECTASDFPAPPPITSPVIRRIRSSPWYREDYNDNLRHLAEQHWRGQSTLDNSCILSLGTRADEQSMVGRASSSFTSFQNVPGSPRTKNGFGREVSKDDSLEWTGKICLQGTLPTSTSEYIQRTVPALQHAKGEKLPVKSQRSLTTLKPSASMPPNAATAPHEAVPAPERQSMGPLGRLPRIIRKVASMRSEAQKREGSIAQTGPAAGKSIPKARSFRSILHSAEADKARERINSASAEWHRPSSWVLGNPSQIIMEHSTLSAQDSRPSEHRADKMLRRQHLSVPASKSQVVCEESDRRGSGSGGVLGAPFLHRSSANQTLKKGISTQEQCEGPNSFINISPEKGQIGSKTGGKRDRMKNLIVRASTSMFGWGKQRADRKSSHDAK